MGGTSLRNEDTEIGRRIWKAIDEAAAKVPQWLQEELRRTDFAPAQDNAPSSDSPPDDNS